MKVDLNFVKQQQNETFLSCVEELEDTFRKNDGVNIKIIRSKTTLTKRILLKMFSSVLSVFNPLIPKRTTTVYNFGAIMGPSFDFLLPKFCLNSGNFVYMFDAWPRFHNIIINFAKALNIKVIFFSSLDVTNKFNLQSNFTKGIWIPEGIKVEDYFWNSYINKNIDVLEFGRKYDIYHDAIEEKLKDHGFVHLYEAVKGEIIFKTKSDFLSGLASAKISICVPSNITHPERAEDISSMTLRYLQSMASKCLIVGVLPREMAFLFDYQPVVEIDFEDPAKQIVEILNNFEAYIPLIERNYLEVQRSHTWSIRVNQMLEIMKANNEK